MRQIALTNKKIRGIPRRLRSLKRWVSNFDGYFRPQSEFLEKYQNWKIPVHSGLIQGRQTNLEIQSFCIAQLLMAAQYLNDSAPQNLDGYYRVACLIVWPHLHQSEVTIFYDQEYYESFLGKENTLAPKLISEKLGLLVPECFVENGHDATQVDDTTPVEWWCIGNRA